LPLQLDHKIGKFLKIKNKKIPGKNFFYLLITGMGSINKKLGEQHTRILLVRNYVQLGWNCQPLVAQDIIFGL
jgi:hypothetical protein